MKSSLRVLARLYSLENSNALKLHDSTQEPHKEHLVKSRMYLVNTFPFFPSSFLPARDIQSEGQALAHIMQTMQLGLPSSFSISST